MSNETKCRGCGKPIRFVANKAGKLIPLDTRAPVFEIKKDFSGTPFADLVENVYVSHFATCAKANEFSSSNRKS